jgi:hypothetical protein
VWRMPNAAQARYQSTGVGMQTRAGGHGAKLPRRAEQAIVALLTHRSVPEAARKIDVRPQTLRLWLEGPSFEAQYAEAACEVYGPRSPSSLHQRLQRLRSRLQQAGGQRAIRRLILVHSVDGRAAGCSVAGPDGRRRWWHPPEGFRKDDLVEVDKSPLPEVAA